MLASPASGGKIAVPYTVLSLLNRVPIHCFACNITLRICVMSLKQVSPGSLSNEDKNPDPATAEFTQKPFRVFYTEQREALHNARLQFLTRTMVFGISPHDEHHTRQSSSYASSREFGCHTYCIAQHHLLSTSQYAHSPEHRNPYFDGQNI